MTSTTPIWQGVRRSLLALAASSILIAPFAMAAASSGTNLPVLKAELDPPRRWVAWSPDEIASITTSEADKGKPTTGLLDGKPGSSSILKQLKGSTTTLVFKQPREIRQLAFVQGGAKQSWVLPLELKLRIDGRDAALVTLQNAPGKIQSIPLGRTVTKLEVQVLQTYSDAQRKQPWGGFSGIGESLYGINEWKFTPPLQDHQRDLRLTIETPVANTATAWIMVGSKLHFDLPPLSLKAGKHTYTVSLDTLKPAQNYGYEFRPRHIAKFVLSGPDGYTPIQLHSIDAVQARVAEDPWEALPPIAFPSRQIDGKTWTEGHSYRTAGRFGNSTYNGLVNEVVSGNWIRTYTAHGGNLQRRQDFDFSIEGFETDSTDSTGELWNVKRRAWNPEREKISANWTTMILERPGKDGASARVTTGLLAPGFLIDAPKTLIFSSRGGGSLPVRSGAPDEEEARFMAPEISGSGKPMIGPSAILTSQGLLTKPQTIRNLREPWIVAIWGIADGKPTFWGDKAVAVLLTADTTGSIEWTSSNLRLPPARWGLSTAFHGLLNDGWKASDVSNRARQLTRLLRTYPVDCREYYLVEDGDVRIRNEFRYDRWGNPAWQNPDYAPLPPIYSWARDSVAWQGIPAGSASSSEANIKTPIGPFRWADGASLEYTLPRTPSRHAAWPRREEFVETYQAMSDEIATRTASSSGPSPSNHPWIIAYHHKWSQGLIGGSYHQPEAFKKLLDVARTNVEWLYAPSSWIFRRELFTGEPYQIYGWLDMSTLPVMFGDPNSNVGQAAYSLYLYALYSGDWATVRRFWPRVMETLRIFEVLNDWAIPGTTSREAVKYGSIDMDTIAYAGVAAMRRMAEVIGEKEDADRLAYMQAKIAGATGFRFNFPRYLDPENKHPRLYGVGFAEDGPAIERASLKNTVALDHIAMVLTWSGEMPEMYDFYLNLLGPDFFTRFQRDFMDVHFSDWRQMAHNQVRSAAHIANRAWLPDWPADGLKADLDAWLAHIKKKHARYETAGMFGSYTAHETGVYFVGWEPSRFISSRYDHATRTLTVELENAQPFELKVHSPSPVSSLKLDGSPQALTGIRSSGNHHTIPLAHGGKIEIRFSTATH
ncbi:hypothetical protein Ga0100231_010405 [Opitutaceae bacterium TAV4]|nr:hypothetical protein Ga0100231_010405 [Opitutaceae bacterium TAV4]RRJ98756.1 hypothetical protein Ga0100230_010510 [Opitutaceae bacterium TAV3]